MVKKLTKNQNEIIRKTISCAIEYIKTIKPSDKVVIVHGHDCDSICSAAIVFKLLTSFNIKPQFVISELNFTIGNNTIEKIEKMKPSYVIVVDIADISEKLDELKRGRNVLVIDHHMPKGYTGIFYSNPRLYDAKIYLPATYIAYKIYENFSNVKEIVWIAGIGVLADNGIKFCNDLKVKIKSLYPDLVDDVELIDEKLFESSLLGKLTKIVDSAQIINGVEGSILALNALLKANSYREILEGKFSESEKLLKLYKKSEDEFNRLVNDFNKNKKELRGKIIIYEIESKFDFKSSLSSYLGKFFDDKIIIIYQKDGEFCNISFRRGRKVDIDLNKLAKESVTGIPKSSGGGHPQASGARVPRKYLNEFFENVQNLT